MEISLRQSPTNLHCPSNIPIIMTSMYDSDENLCKPIQNKEHKSTRTKRLVKQRQIPPNIIIPQVSVSFEDDSGIISPMTSNSSSNTSPVISPSGRIKKKPPPLVIPDSNFFNFKDDIQSAPAESTRKEENRVFESIDSPKQPKAASLDKNVTLFKQKCVNDRKVDDASLVANVDSGYNEGNDPAKDTRTFLGTFI